LRSQKRASDRARTGDAQPERLFVGRQVDVFIDAKTDAEGVR
jgi:hypothetical protein